MKRFYVGSLLSIIVCILLATIGLQTTTSTTVQNYYSDAQPQVPLLSVNEGLFLAAGLIVFFFVIGGINVVTEWKRRPYMRFGRYVGEIGPGLCWINPATDYTLEDVLINDEVSTIQVESVQTKDNVPLSFTLVVTSKVTDVRKAMVNVEYYGDAMEERATASANGTIRAHDLAEILGEGLKFSEQILADIQKKVEPWGISITAIEVKDFKINDLEIEKAISMKARAGKEAEGELVRAEMQHQIASKLNEAAGTLDSNGWRLKSLEVLLELCRSANNNTILIPAELQSLAQALGSATAGKVLPTA